MSKIIKYIKRKVYLLLMLIVFLLFCSCCISFLIDYSVLKSLFFYFVLFCIFSVFFAWFWKFKLVYMLGHELAHYFVGYFFKRRLGKICISKTHASVQVENPNFLILMAPYILPIWVLLAYFLKLFFENFFQLNSYIFVIDVVIILFIAHHFIMTIYALSFKQTDLLKYGKFFSLTFIIMFNSMELYFLLSIPKVGFLGSLEYIIHILKDL